MDPIVSVIIPMYNAESTIERCLESIIHQTFTDFEIIIINDGSTDKSEEIVENWSKSYTKIRLVTIENHGPSYVRKLGTDLARGRYVYYIDADDWAENNLLQVLYDNMQISGCKISNCGYILNDHAYYMLEAERSVISCSEAAERGFSRQYVGGLWCYLFDKSLFNDFQLMQGIIMYEDVTQILHAYNNTDKIVTTRFPLYHYIVNPSSLTHKGIYKDEDLQKTYYHIQKLSEGSIKIWSQSKDNILCYFLPAELAILAAMCRVKMPHYNWKVINDLENKIRKNFLTYIKSHSLLPAYKVSALVLCINKHLFIKLYRAFYRCFHINMQDTNAKSKKSRDVI